MHERKIWFITFCFFREQKLKFSIKEVIPTNNVLNINDSKKSKVSFSM